MFTRIHKKSSTVSENGDRLDIKIKASFHVETGIFAFKEKRKATDAYKVES